MDLNFQFEIKAFLDAIESGDSPQEAVWIYLEAISERTIQKVQQSDNSPI